MRYWAFDDTYLDQETSIVELTSGRKVWIGVGDEIVFFHRQQNDLIFNSHGSVNSFDLEDVGESGFKFMAEIIGLESFEENRHLEDFTYSLKKVYRYNKPLLHFRRPYLEFFEHDFKTILDARIYWARTGFGLFMNQLPNEHIVRFMQKLAESDPGVLLQQTGYKRAWKALRKFVEEEYVSAARVFAAIRSQIEKIGEISDIGLSYSDISLSTDDETDTPDFIEPQERLLTRFAKMLFLEETQSELFYEIDTRIDEEQTYEESFEKIFRGTSWPIQIIEG